MDDVWKQIENLPLTLHWQYTGRRIDTSDVYAISVIQLKLNFKENRAGEKVKHYDCYTTFDMTRSWYIDTIYQYVLEHEQGHFDIGEICARRCRIAIHEYIGEKGFISPNELLTAFNKYSLLLQQMQNDYDEQTRYSHDVEMQQYWEKNIKNHLDSLKMYSRK